MRKFCIQAHLPPIKIHKVPTCFLFNLNSDVVRSYIYIYQILTFLTLWTSLNYSQKNGNYEHHYIVTIKMVTMNIITLLLYKLWDVQQGQKGFYLIILSYFFWQKYCICRKMCSIFFNDDHPYLHWRCWPTYYIKHLNRKVYKN